MTRLIWSPQALQDLEGIRDYISRDSPRYARLVVERIIDGIERLATFPESGRIVPEVNDPAIREIILAPYRVVYRLRSGVAEIATVFRASRLPPSIE